MVLLGKRNELDFILKIVTATMREFD